MSLDLGKDEVREIISSLQINKRQEFSVYSRYKELMTEEDNIQIKNKYLEVILNKQEHCKKIDSLINKFKDYNSKLDQRNRK